MLPGKPPKPEKPTPKYEEDPKTRMSTGKETFFQGKILTNIFANWIPINKLYVSTKVTFKPILTALQNGLDSISRVGRN